MNIVFFHSNGILPTLGGISRITDTLGALFTDKDNDVWYIGMQDKHKGSKYRPWQSFLPSSNLFSDVNVKYIREFVRKHKVDAIINQCALDPRSAEFLSICKKETAFLLISCFHNSILTPVYNGAYQKEYNLKKRGLGVLFYLMKTRVVASLITRAYIIKHRKRYLSTVINSDKVILLCDGQLPELYRMCGIKTSDKVCIIPNCIDVNVEYPKSKEKIVLWVGNFDYSIKRPDNMLRIWKQVEAKHPDWKLFMLGNGPSWEEMKAMSHSLGLKQVRFVGRINPEEYYKQALISCITSVHEAFPMVVIESQKYGCITVVNNSFTSAPLLIQDGINGCLELAFNNNAFAEAIDSLMNNSERLKMMSAKAKESVKRFSLDNVYKEWMQTLQKK